MMSVQKNKGVVEAQGNTSKEINRQIKDLIRAGKADIRVTGVAAQHNLAVGIVEAASIRFEGSVGYYCGGLIDGPDLEIGGSAGWGLGESMNSGTIQVHGNVGNSCAASIRGGTLVIHGNAGARAGVSMKGGLVIIAGDCGYMTGFMMQKGVIIVCGNAGAALADSMYEGCIYVGGEMEELGNDTVVSEPDEDDTRFLEDSLARWGVRGGNSFRKVVSGRRLWNFDKQEIGIWKEAL